MISDRAQSLLVSCSRLDRLRGERERLLMAGGRQVARDTRRLAEVSLSDVRVPLAWRGSAGQLGGQARYAVFCLVSCGDQIYDSGLVMVDRSHTDITFSDIFAFADLGPEFQIKGPFKNIKRKILHLILSAIFSIFDRL